MSEHDLVGTGSRDHARAIRRLHGRAHALSRLAVALVRRAVDARRARRALRHPSAEPAEGGEPRARLSGDQSDGEGAGAAPRRHRHHRARGDLHLSGGRVSGREAQCPDRHAAARRLSQVAVLRPRLPRAGGDRPRGPAQGGGAPRHARLRRFRHHDEHGRGRGREGAVADGRAVHRRRRGHWREHPLGHDLQDDPGAAGVHRLRGAHRRAPRRAARRGEGQGDGGAKCVRASGCQADTLLDSQHPHS